MRLGIALRAFFAALFQKPTAEKIQLLLEDQRGEEDVEQSTAATQAGAPAKPSAPAAPARNDAVTLLAALQREARFVDLIQEDLSPYSDAQVGAAARPALQNCTRVLERLFELKPLVESAEGESIAVPENPSPLRFQWIGEGQAEKAKVVHHGWRVSKVELPQWTGDANDANVVAPAQIQVA